MVAVALRPDEQTVEKRRCRAGEDAEANLHAVTMDSEKRHNPGTRQPGGAEEEGRRRMQGGTCAANGKSGGKRDSMTPHAGPLPANTAWHSHGPHVVAARHRRTPHGQPCQSVLST